MVARATGVSPCVRTCRSASRTDERKEVRKEGRNSGVRPSMIERERLGVEVGVEDNEVDEGAEGW